MVQAVLRRLRIELHIPLVLRARDELEAEVAEASDIQRGTAGSEPAARRSVPRQPPPAAVKETTVIDVLCDPACNGLAEGG
ncbi:hypothetical protein [Kitasatospora sp. NPDC057223]|uniref:hypothetical protein n=1 Tax=Kitasatospora sp. NPDC057223 TaxID=3346055 RepID=UPI00363B01C6